MFLRNADKHGREAEKNLDLRIRKTRRAIRSGLVKACQAKPYAHVSVTDICSASMVSRTTFYDHYTDKDALLAEVVSFLLEEITPALEGLWFGEGRDARAVARHLATYTRTTAMPDNPARHPSWGRGRPARAALSHVLFGIYRLGAWPRRRRGAAARCGRVCLRGAHVHPAQRHEAADGQGAGSDRPCA